MIFWWQWFQPSRTDRRDAERRFRLKTLDNRMSEFLEAKRNSASRALLRRVERDRAHIRHAIAKGRGSPVPHSGN